MSKKSKPASKGSELRNEKASFVFKKINYQLMIASIIVIFIGFVLMIGDTNIYSFTKITLSPLVVVLGFALGVVAILFKPKTKA